MSNYREIAKQTNDYMDDNNPTFIDSIIKYKFSITISVAIILIIAIIYIVYINTLPFGFSKSSTIIVGAEDDTMQELKVLPSSSWGNRAVNQNTQLYRELRGSAEIGYEPGVVLTGTKVTATVQSDSVGMYSPKIEFDKNNYNWTEKWDFSKEIPNQFIGTAFMFDYCTFFEGNSNILTQEKSEEKYEKGPFSIYVEWMPMQELDSQQIVGHFNWELFQSKNNILFQLGKTTDAANPFYSIKAPIDSQFFNKKHWVLIQYSPDLVDGYIEMFLDGKFIERKYLKNAVIDTTYGERNLTLGWSSHNYQKNPYFKGCVYNFSFADSITLKPETSIEFISETPTVVIPVTGNGKIYGVTIEAVKK